MNTHWLKKVAFLLILSILSARSAEARMSSRSLGQPWDAGQGWTQQVLEWVAENLGLWKQTRTKPSETLRKCSGGIDPNGKPCG